MHPRNKLERLEIAKNKSERRLRTKYGGYSGYDDVTPQVKYGITYEIALERKQRWIYRHMRFLRNTGTPCSCSMCGNPRRYFGGITLQEKRFAERTKALYSSQIYIP